jgi:hypothetical protein
MEAPRKPEAAAPTPAGGWLGKDATGCGGNDEALALAAGGGKSLVNGAAPKNADAVAAPFFFVLSGG